MMFTQPIPLGYEWQGEWAPEVREKETDADGWQYAGDFRGVGPIATWHASQSVFRNARRRRWCRFEVLSPLRAPERFEPRPLGSGVYIFDTVRQLCLGFNTSPVSRVIVSSAQLLSRAHGI